ncbi:50S ribosomal protein L24 [Granulicella mallensis]|uniref:Large ribosomal subunit protein uL24 n=1 Tax=Granulicella mallensis (strain ATCC BAA-1857 / DSM 23137 / MP5ACTX8) TaxID=682795 RepID=G8NQ78_GRAMM|nr:ribosomal protein L24 [Granulicella mallensis MP5ACTX8]
MPSKFKPIIASKIRIKRNDQVIVIAGKDKGKKGRVLRVIVAKQRVLVEGVGMIKKHVKPDPQRNVAGGIAEQEAPIHVSNVMLVDSEGKATRLGHQVEGNKKTRVARTNGVVIADKVEKKAKAKK